jgi:sugar lactone lactonase YvrE
MSATENCGDGGLAVQARLNAPEGVGVNQFGDIFIADTGNNRIRMVSASTGIITTVAGRNLTNRELGLDDNGNPVKNPQTGTNFSAASAPFPNSCGTSAGNSSTTRVGATSPCAPVGDGKDPLQAVLATPRQIVVDTAGNVFFTDSANVRIRELVANPVSTSNAGFTGFSGIVTVVGTGSSGNAGDGGNAKLATVSNGLSGLSLDPQGRLFFTDRSNNRARVFDTNTGLVTAVAGAQNFNGDQVALQTMFSNPTGIAVDSAGNIYVADSGNNLIRKIGTDNKVVTIAGQKSGGDAASENIDPLTAALNNPTGLWVDPSGATIYFADTGTNRIRRISGGTISTVAGCIYTRLTTASTPAQNCTFTADGLPATVTKINLSGGTTQNTKRFTGVAVDSKGVVYFSQSGDNILRKLNSDGTLVTIAGQFGVAGLGGDGGKAVNMFISNPTGIAVDNDGNIIFADTANFAAHIISNGIVYPLAGEPGNNDSASETTGAANNVATPAWLYRWRAIQGVAVDNKGNVFLADASNNKVDRIPYAAPAACVPAEGKTCPANSGQFQAYRVIGNLSNTANEFVFDYSAAASATALGHTVQLSFPTGVAVDSNGDVFVTDSANNLIREAVAPAPAK